MDAPDKRRKFAVLRVVRLIRAVLDVLQESARFVRTSDRVGWVCHLLNQVLDLNQATAR